MSNHYHHYEQHAPCPYDVPGLGLHHEILQGTGYANHGGLEELPVFTSCNCSFRKSQISKAPTDSCFDPSRFLLRPAHDCMIMCFDVVLSTCAVTDFYQLQPACSILMVFNSSSRWACVLMHIPSRTVGRHIFDFRTLGRLRNNSRHRCWRHDLDMPRSANENMRSSASNPWG